MAPRSNIRTYGKKKINTVATSTIFGEASPPIPSCAARNPLSDVTAQLQNLNIDHEDEEYGENEAYPSQISANTSQSSEENLRDEIEKPKHSPNLEAFSTHDFSNNPSIVSHSSIVSQDDSALRPLTESYKADRGEELPITPWDDLIPRGAHVEKIAEASFAEVYRVVLDSRSSILKVMQLKVPSDLLSAASKSAVDVETVVSEVRLMNVLAEAPGFVTFKEAHLARGRPCSAIVKAYSDCKKWNPSNGTSEFPNPALFQSSAVFLVIELGDAGTVLDDIPMQDIYQVWDTFLGVVISLGVGENHLQFEHRDMHESNICIKFGEPTATTDSDSHQKYGFSGIKTTIIDYGLSRATLENGDEVYYDLENDLSVFHGSPGHTQFDTYRRMRSHLFTGGNKMFPKAWHSEKSKALNNGHTWREFVPYTNVLWIKYILNYLKKDLKDNVGSTEELRQFELQTAELKRRLDPRTLARNGAFTCANDVAEYIAEMGWITSAQVAAMSENQDS